MHPRSRREVAVCDAAHVSQSVLSHGVRVEEGASVQNSVLLPGVHIGRGARVRNAIIEEGVHIPKDFQIGWDIEHDRKYHTVSAKGIVVVRETPKMQETVMEYSTREKTVVGFKPSAQRARRVA